MYESIPEEPTPRLYVVMARIHPHLRLAKLAVISVISVDSIEINYENYKLFQGICGKYSLISCVL